MEQVKSAERPKLQLEEIQMLFYDASTEVAIALLRTMLELVPAYDATKFVMSVADESTRVEANTKVRQEATILLARKVSSSFGRWVSDSAMYGRHAEEQAPIVRELIRFYGRSAQHIAVYESDRENVRMFLVKALKRWDLGHLFGIGESQRRRECFEALFATGFSCELLAQRGGYEEEGYCDAVPTLYRCFLPAIGGGQQLEWRQWDSISEWYDRYHNEPYSHMMGEHGTIAFDTTDTLMFMTDLRKIYEAAEAGMAHKDLLVREDAGVLIQLAMRLKRGMLKVLPD
ncbi:MAG: hypothetical protein U0517_01630 [Candidatus Andersenbacteria bacterium]